MSFFYKPTATVTKSKISPVSSTQQNNWYDESTYLDNSTVPTYEEFTTKTKTKVKKKKSILRKKLGYLNSTEASCLLTDDETDDDDEEDNKNFSPTIDELTNTINNLEIKNQNNTLIFNNNHLNRIHSPAYIVQPLKNIQSKENLLIIQDTPEKRNNYDTPLKNVVVKPPIILTGTAPPKLVASSLFQNNPASIKAITPTVYRSPSVYSPSTSRLNDSNEYVFYYNKITQTSFVFSSADESNKKSSKEPSVIVLNDSIEEDDSDSDNPVDSRKQIMKKLVISQTCSSCSGSPSSPTSSPQISSELLDRLNNITLRRSNKPKTNESSRKSLAFNSNKSKRISICGDGMSKEQLRINETILDESENESDYKNGRIYSLYESASEGDLANDSDSDKSITNQQQEQQLQLTTPKITSKKWSKSKGMTSTSDSSATPKRKSKQKTSNLMNKLKSEDATTSSDGKYEKFINEMKLINKKKESTENAKRKDDIKNFIVDDDDEEEEINDSSFSNKKNIKSKKKISSSDSSSTSSSEDEQLFYIRTTQKFNDKDKKSDPKKQKSKISRSSLLNDSSSSSSSSESSFNSSTSSDENSAWKKIRKNKTNNIFKTPTVPNRKIETDSRLIKTQQAVKHKQQQHLPIKLSFVESLSTKLEDESQRDPAVQVYMKKYKNKNVRNELLRECFNKLNEGAFENKLPKDMKLIWNSKLTATGGFCKNSIKDQTSQIELSTKVCDTPERMRDVLAHEMCHAATFLLNGILDGHGSIWKNWAARVNFTYKQIPKITVYHSYQIKKKFIYKCQRCLSEIHRFSKSIDINKQVCGICHGKFDLINANKPQQATATFDDIINNDERGEFTKTKLVPAATNTPKQLNAFSQFVKDNYRSIKQEKNIAKHQEVMKELSVQFKQLSTKK